MDFFLTTQLYEGQIIIISHEIRILYSNQPVFRNACHFLNVSAAEERMVPGTWHFRDMVFQLPFELLGASQILKKKGDGGRRVGFIGFEWGHWLVLVYGCQPKNRGRCI